MSLSPAGVISLKAETRERIAILGVKSSRYLCMDLEGNPFSSVSRDCLTPPVGIITLPDLLLTPRTPLHHPADLRIAFSKEIQFYAQGFCRDMLFDSIHLFFNYAKCNRMATLTNAKFQSLLFDSYFAPAGQLYASF